MDDFENRAAAHDLGGRSRFTCQPVDRSKQEPLDDFGRTVDAIRIIVSGAGLMSVDELRRGVESLSAEQQETMGYYEKWIHSICSVLIEKQVVTKEELQ